MPNFLQPRAKEIKRGGRGEDWYSFAISAPSALKLLSSKNSCYHPATPMHFSFRLLALAALAAALTYSAAARAPNVIVVMTDDQGYGDLSAHGNPVLKTPALDQLHNESVRFTDFHVAPMCTPTRGQLMTGRDALANGAMNVSSGRTLLRRGIPTMAGTFAGAGYATGQFGKWHLGDNYPYRPQDRGFQETVWFPSSHVSSAPDHWNNDYFDDTYQHNGAPRQYRGYCTDVFFDEAMKWMDDCVRRDRPFFTYLAPNAPHGPLLVGPEWRAPYASQPPAVAAFFGMIANIDHNMARLDAFLRERGLRDDTILIFLTDNGGTAGVPVFNAGMRGRKIDLYEGGHRVPCFVRWPAGNLRPPGPIAELTLVQDIFPTLLDLCGVKPPPGAAFDGVSLAALLWGKSDRLADRMNVIQFSRMNDPVPKSGDAAVLWQRWRLVQNAELYDLATDPGQKSNVVAQHPDIAAKMRAHYAAWWARHEPRLNETERIIVGAPAENPTLLSPCDWRDVFVDQSRQVRAGIARNGVWHIEVARDGDYEISLRRWPAEADTAIVAALPPHEPFASSFPAGKALAITTARLAVGDFDATRPVAVADKSVIFTAVLKAGPAQLQTWFADAKGEALCGAYYVYVRIK